MADEEYNRFDLPYPPEYISLSGADDSVDPGELIKITNQYNAQFGILVSPSKRGVARYPSLSWIMNYGEAVLLNNDRLREQMTEGGEPTLMRSRPSIHVCGDYIDMMREDGYFGLEYLVDYGYGRFQFNLAGTEFDKDFRKKIREWVDNYNVEAIIQVDEFPNDDEFTYLLDRSRGKGIHSEDWPSSSFRLQSTLPGDFYLIRRDWVPGFAGGISEHNILKTCFKLTQESALYFLDMESSLRGPGDKFDPEACRRVCSKVFGHREEYFYEPEAENTGRGQVIEEVVDIEHRIDEYEEYEDE